MAAERAFTRAGVARSSKRAQAWLIGAERFGLRDADRTAMLPDQAALLLYVEDDPLIQFDVEAALTEAGFCLRTASTGGEALAHLEHGINLQAVVTDINLGEGPDGWEVARRARELKPSVAVVYVSAHGALDWSARGVPNSLMITKPFVAAQIVVAVASLLNQASSAPPPV